MKFTYVSADETQVEGLKAPYNLALPFEQGFKTARHKALVVIGHVPSKDLKNKALLSDDLSHTTFTNVIEYAKRIAKSYGKVPDYKFGFINFNNVRWYDETPDVKKTAVRLAAKRVRSFIRKLQPDLIIIMGDEAAEAITRDKTIATKRGLIHDFNGIKLVNTIEIDRSFNPPNEDSDDLDDDSVEYANILGYAARNIAHGLLGHHPFSLKHLKPNYKLIENMGQFKRLMRNLHKAPYIAVDTEGTSLETFDNVLQTIQFSFDETVSYILPILHKDSNWTKEELETIHSELRSFFSQTFDWYNGTKTRYLIGQNFGYDMRMLMRWLNLRYWYWPTWDVMAGTFGLDENVKSLQKYGTSAYGLAQTLLSYDNDFYQTAEFGKSQRTTISQVDLDKPVLEYAAMDTIALIALHKAQLKQASLLDHNGESYLHAYHRLILTQLSSMVRVMAMMKYRGTQLNLGYLLNLLKPDSPLVGYIEQVTADFYKLPEVVQANNLLKGNKGIPTNSLFGGSSGRVFQLDKREHLQTLFIDILQLEPLKYGKNGDPSFDKFFLKAYREEQKSADLIFRLNSLNKLKSSYVDAFYNHIENSQDGRVDGRLRPDFGYTGVVTGRSNSSRPSLQQIPEHSEDAKLVKKMFTVPPLTLHFEADYSAHEVRCWGLISGDNVLNETFNFIHKLIVRFRKRPSDRNKTNLKTNGDPHKVNYSFFTGTPVEQVSKEQRQDSKGITFGAMYGKGAPSLSRDIKRSLEETVDIMERFFRKFAKAGKWLKWAVSFSQKNLYVFSPIGRRRNLFGYLSAHRGTQAAMSRRAQNSPIQGFASDICFMAADLFARHLHECYEKLGIEHDSYEKFGSCELTYLPTGPNAMVHDSIKGEAPFDLFFLNLHLLEWAMTNGARHHLESIYGVTMETVFDIEMDIGADWATKDTWDWTDAELDRLFIEGIENHKKTYLDNKAVQRLEPQKVLESAKASYQKQRKLLDLDNRFPLNTK